MNSIISEPEVEQFKLTHAPLDIDAVYRAADVSSNGAVVIMTGMVRDRTRGRAVNYLDYQAYEEMALRVFEQIAQACQTKYATVNRVVIHHRLGKLLVGEISVLIAVGSPHRAEAFDACEYAIDTLKYNAPIWKKEYWQDGESTWVAGL